ncbi:hypothetical protein D3C77_787420 [compost metagenome]
MMIFLLVVSAGDVQVFGGLGRHAPGKLPQVIPVKLGATESRRERVVGHRDKQR